MSKTKSLFLTVVLASTFTALRAVAQDQGSTPAPAPAPTTPKKGSGHESACKDDVQQYCADAKGRKAVWECLKSNEDKLSDACKAERAKMATHRKKHSGD